MLQTTLEWKPLGDSKDLIAQSPFGAWLAFDLDDDGWSYQAPDCLERLLVRDDDMLFRTKEAALDAAQKDLDTLRRDLMRVSKIASSADAAVAAAAENFELRIQLRRERERKERLQAVLWLIGIGMVAALLAQWASG